MDKRIVIEGGKVHGVGFRPFLFENARMLRLERFAAENVYADGREVLIVSFGGAEKAVNGFAEFCRTARPKNAVVLRVREEKPPEDIFPIREYGEILASNQQRTMVQTGLAMLEKQDVMIEKQDVMIGKQDVMIDKQDVMIGKQDVMIEKQDVMIDKQDVMIGKQDVMIDKQDVMIGLQEKTIEKLDGFHQDTIQRFDAANYRFEKLLQELKEERLEARKSTERIITMIAGMKSGGVVRERKAVYGAPKKDKKKR
ncbi:MAG: acylphosphatase [Candidatus Altiarchaeia archaeon]